MAWIGIGVALLIAGLSSFESIENRLASVVIVVVAMFLVCYGSYEIWGKPRILLKRRIKKWLLKRNWSVEIEEKPEICFIVRATDDSNREVVITRHKDNKDVLVFTAAVNIEKNWDVKLAGLNDIAKRKLLEEIKILLAIKDMGYVDVEWPLEVKIQHVLILDTDISGYFVDLKAKSVINAVIGVRSIIRKAIAY